MRFVVVYFCRAEILAPHSLESLPPPRPPNGSTRAFSWFCFSLRRRLTDGVASADRQALVPGLAPLTLVNAAGRGAESTAVGGSVRNLFEAQTVAVLVASLLSTRDNGGDIGGGGGGVRVSGGGGGLPAASIGVICLCASA